MASTCNQLLDVCLRGESWSSDVLDRSVAEDGGRTLMSVVVERLGDLFEPRLCDVYDRLFRQVIERVTPELIPRLQNVGARPLPLIADRVYVLSRITLGADVAVTSVLLEAAKRRYPSAEITFVGPRKNYELFENDPRIRHRDVAYARVGSLQERLRASAKLWFEDGIVLDPDSRLTQLGLISVCDSGNYFLFPSRSFGGGESSRLPDLAAQWVGDPKARPYVAPEPATGPSAEITVSLGVGENPAKRIGGDFERDLFKTLGDTGASVLVDLGGTPDEATRVRKSLQPGMRSHEGAFAPFAAEIARSKLFVGYDSAAGHVASASGVPLISIAKGFASERMAARWRPIGTVVDGGSPDVLDQVRRTLATCTFRR